VKFYYGRKLSRSSIVLHALAKESGPSVMAVANCNDIRPIIYDILLDVI